MYNNACENALRIVYLPKKKRYLPFYRKVSFLLPEGASLGNISKC